MNRFRNSAALLLLGASTAGCISDYQGSKPQFVSNRSLYSENQPVVDHTNYVFDVAASGNGLSTAELGRLGDWFKSLDLRYGDRISIDQSYETDAVREDVARLAASYGLLLSDGAPITAGNVDPGTARIIVTRASAKVPNCPNWRQSTMMGGSISTESNYGCSTNSNLAAMIANPDDLVLGRQGSISGDSLSVEKSVKQYRDKKPTGGGGLGGGGN